MHNRIVTAVESVLPVGQVRSIDEMVCPLKGADRQPAGAAVPDYEAWAAEKIAKLVPLNRWQMAEDVAAMAVFLASARAANVTGQTVNVDGGYVMR